MQQQTAASSSSNYTLCQGACVSPRAFPSFQHLFDARPSLHLLCRLSSSSASSFLWRLTRPSLAGRCPAQTLLYYFPILHCFSATRTSRDTLLPIGDMTALKTATPLSPSSPSSPRRYHRHYRQGCHHCHRRGSCSREVAAACAHLQLHTQRCSCSRAAAARRFVRSTQNTGE